MTALDTKLVRNVLHMKGQVTAIIAVIACGIATYVMALSTMESLTVTRDRYYQQYRFAHVFAGMKRAPDTLVERISEIPGVAKVNPRIVRDVTLDVAGFNEPVVGRLISVPDHGEPALNGLHLRKGRWIEPGRTGEVLVNEAFADAHRLGAGDTVKAIINGRKKELTIVGMAITPEYIYQLKEGEVLPDDRRFGLFWMAKTDLASAFDMDGAFNNVTLSITRSASVPDVLKQLDDLIEPYGGLGSYDRHDQTSHQYLDNEITQLRSMGTIAPVIFLSVASFLLNVVLSRLISTQREEIAALKAFGYTGWEIGWHYIKFVLLIVSVGTLVGTLLGSRMGQGLTELYLKFYRFPMLEFRFNTGVILSALGIALAAGVLGTLAAVRQAVTLPPAEAMRPQPPAEYRPTVLERIGLQKLFSQSARIILRNLERRPLKALFSCLGIAMGISVLIVGSYMKDSIDYVVDMQFFHAERQDMTVSFVEPLSYSAVHEVEHLPGVRAAEPFRAVPARLRSEHHSRRVGILGLPRGGKLFLPLDMSGKNLEVPEDGILMSRVLAEVLDLRAGDAVQVEVLDGKRPRETVRIAGLIDDFAGLQSFMSLDSVRAMLKEGDSVSGMHLLVDDAQSDTLYAQLKNTPKVAGVGIKRAALQSFRETIAENLLRMQTFNVIFATVIAFGVVYNSARISLSERSRELATLRVIGFTRGEISVILLGELAVLVLVSIPLGLFLGHFFAWLTTFATVDTEMFRIPLAINRSTDAFAVTVTIVATVISGLIVRRRLDHLDLIAVLKTRD